MRTLLSVYEQLQVLKGALGEKTTLTLINMMMGSPTQAVPRKVVRRADHIDAKITVFLFFFPRSLSS